ncbi:signal peptidase II [bacterium]
MSFTRQKTLIWAFVILFLDQLTKFLIIMSLEIGQSIVVIPKVFYITHVRNTGVAFGLAKGFNIIFIIISLFFIVFLLTKYKSILLYFKNKTFLININTIIGMFLGGALGNLVDRIFRGSVVDFLNFVVWPVFNVADSSITIAGIVLAIYLFKY